MFKGDTANDRVDAVLEYAERAKTFIEGTNSAIEATNKTIKAALGFNEVSDVVGRLGEFVSDMSAIGEHAPLVGVAFAFLSFVGNKLKSTSGTAAGYDELRENVRETYELLKEAGANDSVPHAAVQKVMVKFRDELIGLTVTLFALSREGFLKRMWNDTKYAEQLSGMTKKIEAIKSDLHLVMQSYTLQMSGDTLQAVKVMQPLAQIAADNSMTIKDNTTRTDDNVKRLVVALLEEKHAQQAVVPTIDEATYSSAVIDSFSKLSGIAELLTPTEGSVRGLGLQSIFVCPDVRCTDDFHPDELELPDRDIDHLRRTGQLSVVAARVKSYQTRMAAQKRRSAIDVIADIAVTRAVILGHAGTGKSSCLRYYMLSWAEKWRGATAEQRAQLEFPILVELKMYKKVKGASQLTLFQYIANTGGSANAALGEQALAALLTDPTRSVLLLLDGLDEIFGEEERDVIVGDIKTFLNTHCRSASSTATSVDSTTARTGIRVVLTSRIVGYRPSDWIGYQHNTLRPLSPHQISVFVRLWHDSAYTASEAAVRVGRRERLQYAIYRDTSIASLASNPLLLTMLAIVNRDADLPTRRVELYERCVDVLIDKWKPVPFDEMFATTTTRDLLAFGPREKQRLLRELAWEMQNISGNGIQQLGLIIEEERLEAVVLKHVNMLERLICPPSFVAREVVKQLRRRHSVLQYLGGTSYSFVHRSFLEYFYAAHYAELWKEHKLSAERLQQLFRDHGRDDSWEQVLWLLCGMIDTEHIEPCIDLLLDMGAPHLAAGCIGQLLDRSKAADVDARCRLMVTEVVLTLQKSEMQGDLFHGPGVYGPMDVLREYWRDEHTRFLLTAGGRTWPSWAR